MRVRKLSSDWVPSENKSLQVGEIIDISDAKSLVDQGLAIYVDENDEDYEKIPVAWEYRKKVFTPQQEVKKEKRLTPEEKRLYIKTLRTEQLEKARKAKREKDLERKLKEQEEALEKSRLEAIEALNGKPL
jgi:hypothetical protein